MAATLGMLPVEKEGMDGSIDHVEDGKIEAEAEFDVAAAAAEKKWVPLLLISNISLISIDRLVRKIDMRIMPATALIYLLCYLDRSNIGKCGHKIITPTNSNLYQGNAKILNSSTKDDLLSSINMTTYEYTVALMVFLVAYSLFEAPSNLAMKIFSPPR